MKILIVHNTYLNPGGEDQVVLSEKVLLESKGHQVILYRRSNAEFMAMPLAGKLFFLLKEIVWSTRTFWDMRALIQEERPDLVHIHNIWVMVSPSIYDACKVEGVPVVQTLHNYRFLCANGLLFRAHRVCEACLSGCLYHAIRFKCWQGSHVRTWAVTRVLLHLQKRDKLKTSVDAFIAPSEFTKDIFVRAGFPAAKIHIKAHFSDVDEKNAVSECGEYALFVGALRDYKGVQELIEAWSLLDSRRRLKIVGDGPLRAVLEDVIVQKHLLNVEFLGQKDHDTTLRLIHGARFLIAPSLCYETFGRVVVEAFSCGVPVLVSYQSAMAELVEEGETGWIADPYDISALAEKIERAFVATQKESLFSVRVHQNFKSRFTAESNYAVLMGIYAEVLKEYRTQQIIFM